MGEGESGQEVSLRANYLGAPEDAAFYTICDFITIVNNAKYFSFGTTNFATSSMSRGSVSRFMPLTSARFCAL
jgi:hypothetical protein